MWHERPRISAFGNGKRHFLSVSFAKRFLAVHVRLHNEFVQQKSPRKTLSMGEFSCTPTSPPRLWALELIVLASELVRLGEYSLRSCIIHCSSLRIMIPVLGLHRSNDNKMCRWAAGRESCGDTTTECCSLMCLIACIPL